VPFSITDDSLVWSVYGAGHCWNVARRDPFVASTRTTASQFAGRVLVGSPAGGVWCQLTTQARTFSSWWAEVVPGGQSSSVARARIAVGAIVKMCPNGVSCATFMASVAETEAVSSVGLYRTPSPGNTVSPEAAGDGDQAGESCGFAAAAAVTRCTPPEPLPLQPASMTLRAVNNPTKRSFGPMRSAVCVVSLPVIVSERRPGVNRQACSPDRGE
jgi:hypothetical protein